MPLDPEIERWLKQLPAEDPAIYQADRFQLARFFRETSRKMPQPEIFARSVRELSITGKNGKIAIRIYYPHEDAPTPVVVNYHGGGWVLGSIASDDQKIHALTNLSGCAMVSVGYRLAPEHLYPQPLEDCYFAAQWVYENCKELGFDPERFGVAGASAGGNLAAAVTLMARDQPGPKIKAQFLTYPVCNADFNTDSYIKNGKGYGLTRTRMQWFWDQYCGDADRLNAYACPLLADPRGLPPGLIITSEFDPLLDEGVSYAEHLQSAGIDIEHHTIKGTIHGFLATSPHSHIAKSTLQLTADAMRRFLS